MGTIVTFYSYKGGVGRSMALANVALLLARRGMKVLTVDWDLEAPGLERYFDYFRPRDPGLGLLRMFVAAQEGSADYRSFCTTIDCEAPHPITLLASGREQYADYTRELERFDWAELFTRHHGGDFVEELRGLWREQFDIVLIDSRTGLSDSGGICTIQLPDVVVAMFTANLQSMYGVRDVMRLAQGARQGLAYDRMPLTVLPLPARWGMGELSETQVWLGRVTDVMTEFFDDWLPRPLTARDVLERLRVPQQDFFSFGERLAVVEQGTADPGGLGFIYERIAAILAQNFTDIASILGIKEVPTIVAPPAGGVASAPSPKVSVPDGYQYDVYVSHDGSGSDWVLKFLEDLKQELGMLLPDHPKMFFDLQEVRTGEVWKQATRGALMRSRVMLALLTPRYVASSRAIEEFRAFARRNALTGKRLLLPIAIRPFEIPSAVPELMQLQWFDVGRTASSGVRGRSKEWREMIVEIARTLQEMISSAPPYDPSWDTKTSHAG